MSDAFVLRVLRRKQQVPAAITRRINQPIKAYLMPRLQTMSKSREEMYEFLSLTNPIQKGGFRMIHVPSRLPGESFSLYHLEETMKPLGYVINGNWDYDHGYFDYKIDNRDGYTFLRVPFTAEKGQLDQPGVVVKMGHPFLLKHVYQDKLDDHAMVGNVGASFNQFQEPKEKDGDVSKAYAEIGFSLVKELEDALL